MKVQWVAWVFCAILSMGAVLAPSSSSAQEAKTFAIDAQPLSGALLDFAEQSGLEVLFDARLAEGKTSPGVSGDLPTSVALERLLAGTGLMSRSTGEATVTVEVAREGTGPVRLSTITVMGERRTQTLQETTASVTVFDEDDIARGDSKSIYRILDRAPNVLPASGESLPPIRGETTTGPTGLLSGALENTQPRAPLIVDGITRIATGANDANQSTFDLEQVEVLRGPQSTNQGANAIAGAYIVKSKDPVFETEHAVRATTRWDEFSDFTHEGSVMTNLALPGDELATRLVVNYENGAAVPRYRNGLSSTTFSNAGDLDSLSHTNNLELRNKWLVEPSEFDSLSVLATFEHQRGRDISEDDRYSGPGVTGLSDDARVSTTPYVVFASQSNLASAKVDYDVPGIGTFTSLSAWQRAFSRSHAASLSTVSYEYLTQRRVSQDLLYEFGEDDSALKGVVGGAYTHRITDMALAVTGFPATGDGHSRSYALFGDGTYSLTPRFHVLAGLRLERYISDMHISFNNNTIQDSGHDVDVFLPKIGFQFDLTDDHTLSFVGRRGYNPGGATIDTAGFTASSFEAEFVKTAEATYRGSFLDDAVTLNATTFFNQFDGKQVQYNISPTSIRTLNMEKAYSYGAELEATAEVHQDWTISVGAGFLNTKITKPNSQSQPVKGNRFGQDPAYTVSADVVWNPIQDLEISLGGLYVPEYNTDFNNTSGREVGDYVLLDLGVAYDYKDLTFRLFARNLLDQLAKTAQPSVHTFRALPPRTFGGSLNVTF